MRMHVLLVALLFSGPLRAAEQKLTHAEVKKVAFLVLQKEYNRKDEISDPTYDKKAGVWSCRTLSGIPDGEVWIEIRDSDGFFKTSTYGPLGKPDEFKMRTSLRRSIAKIVETKK